MYYNHPKDYGFQVLVGLFSGKLLGSMLAFLKTNRNQNGVDL